jgi:putative methyltransferase (TIGR04325 family)
LTDASVAHRVRDFLEGPATRPLLLQWRRRHFLSPEGFGFYFGVFDSFEAARRSLPSNPGFGNEALAQEYVGLRSRRIFAYDYPVMWWLARAFSRGATRVLDIGGSVGVHFYAYSAYMDMPAALAWRIVEVPAVVNIGRRVAAERGAAALRFTDDLGEALRGEGADIWLSAGALQYMEEGRPDELLRRCATLPAHVVLNKLPLYPGDDFVCTQNIGHGCFAPLWVFNRERFVCGIEALGYVLRDEWDVHERSLYLPGHPERSFPAFSGLYFSLRPTTPFPTTGSPPASVSG